MVVPRAQKTCSAAAQGGGGPSLGESIATGMMSGPAIPDGRSRRASARTSRHAPSAASCRTSVRPTSPVAPATTAPGAELTLARSLLHVRPAVLGRGRAVVVGHGQLHVVV